MNEFNASGNYKRGYKVYAATNDGLEWVRADGKGNWRFVSDGKPAVVYGWFDQ